MSKTTAKDVKNVLDKYITEVKEEADEKSFFLTKEKIKILECIFNECFNACVLTDFERKNVEYDEKEFAKVFFQKLLQLVRKK